LSNGAIADRAVLLSEHVLMHGIALIGTRLDQAICYADCAH
jgi:hypothetical protein